MKWEEVFFPIATHYSWNTAHNISEVFKKYYETNKFKSAYDKKIFKLYKDYYNLNSWILKTFVEPMNILDFYNQETLWELKSLWVSWDYEYSYTTWHKDFWKYINTIINIYKDKSLLVKNNKNEIAIDYDNEDWKSIVKEQIENVNFIQLFHKNNIISAMKNIRNDWSLLRDNWYWVVFEDEWKDNWKIIDPMFDSELFMIFDLYIKFKKDYKIDDLEVVDIFKNLFNVLNWLEESKFNIVEDIVDWLKSTVCVCEEHLKNWLVKKFYSETKILAENYRTKDYFLLWMWLLNWKRMSASRWTAILSSDLINTYGGINSRIIMIFSWWHPSKTFEYNINWPNEVNEILKKFSKYYLYLILSIKNNFNSKEKNIDLNLIENKIVNNIEKWYFKQALIELLVIIPKNNPQPNIKTSKGLLNIYNKYLDILSPWLINNFCYE